MSVGFCLKNSLPITATLCLGLWGGGNAAMAQLKTALEVRSLSAEVAETELAVDLTAVVIFADPPATVFVQDDTAGTFFRLEGAVSPRPGDVVHVRGATFPGLYLPGIEMASFDVLKHQGLPEALPVSYDDLASGRFHYQRVAMEGVVRAISTDEEGASTVRLAVGARVIDIRVDQSVLNDDSLINSFVRVSGLAAGEINDRRQLVRPYLRVGNWAEFEILEKAPSLDETPTVSPAELLQFDASGRGGQRVKLSGIVLAVFPDGELFLRDDEASINVRLLQRDSSLKAGDLIQVAGFPAMERYSASLVDASIVEITEETTVPEPVDLELPELIKGENDGNLVSIDAILGDFYRGDGGATILILNEKGRTVQASVPSIPNSLVTGARIRVAGICEVVSARGLQYRSQAESILLRILSPADIQILREPSWWTSRRMANILFVLFAGILLAGLWITLLKRQVRNQTRALRDRIESEAALVERQRLAREFHDTLEQDLAGLSLRLDAATARGTDQKMQTLLEGSRSLVSRIQSETRNLVSDLRHSPDQFASLELALEELISRQSVETGPSTTLKIPDLPPMPSRTVHHLKMIAQEAVTNALKHAGAENLTIEVSEKNGQLIMRISDDGTGFEVEAETRGKAGHFGCMGIRERCRKIGAEVKWASQSDKGTSIEVRMST